MIDMRLSDEVLARFTTLYARRFGEELAPVDANQAALALIRLVDIAQSGKSKDTNDTTVNDGGALHDIE
jgi:hypothetical protein